MLHCMNEPILVWDSPEEQKWAVLTVFPIPSRRTGQVCYMLASRRLDKLSRCQVQMCIAICMIASTALRCVERMPGPFSFLIVICEYDIAVTDQLCLYLGLSDKPTLTKI